MSEPQRIDVYHHNVGGGCDCGALIGFLIACAALGWPLAELPSPWSWVVEAIWLAALITVGAVLDRHRHGGRSEGGHVTGNPSGLRRVK